MNKEQLDAAKENMVEWLSDPHELGRTPSKIECAGEVERIRAYWVEQAKK